ncbi:MAG: glycosyltransferase family 2 protein [Tannerellaceae bacterium]
MGSGINNNKNMQNISFDIPIVLFSFKRVDKLLKIIDRISSISPQNLYIVSDGGRDINEHQEVLACRAAIEKAIVWDCKLTKFYSDTNIGVYENIAGGAKKVFEIEKFAIFLEDDNLPELSFFQFCKEMLYYYEYDSRVLWICGTNYLVDYEPEDKSSYVFTKNMMPCGWASWSDKFLKYYDGDLLLWKNSLLKEKLKNEYIYKPLMFQDFQNWDDELRHKQIYGRYISWDYQMSFSQRVHGVYAIVPKYNQICNIGVDEDSIHKGNSFDNIMIQRFCGLPTKSIEFPLKHPSTVLIDTKFELKVAKIITLPLSLRMRKQFSRIIKKIFRISQEQSLRDVFKR